MRTKLAVALFAVATPALAASPFDAPPSRFADAVNPVLKQVKSKVTVRAAGCSKAKPPTCQFSAREADVRVAGSDGGTGRVTVGVTFSRAGEAEAARLLEAAMSVVGATMIAYDVGLPGIRRGELINQLGEAALEDGEAHLDSDDVHYGLAFDDTSGRLEIVAAPIRLAHG